VAIPKRMIPILAAVAIFVMHQVWGSGPAPAAASAPVQIRDLTGQWLRPFNPPGAATVVFFVSSDCPISNAYAPEIQRLCKQYGSRGIGCALLYEDLQLDAAAARRHLAEYRYVGIPAAVDGDRTIAGLARASVTPQAVVVDAAGAIRYRGRIDNRYAALGKTRQQITVHDVSDALDDVLAGRRVSNPETEALGCYIVPSDISKKRK
jgi:hypothetical protein